MNTEPELLNERLERLAMVLDEIMPNCALLVRDALELLKEQDDALEQMRLDNEDLRKCYADLLKEQEPLAVCEGKVNKCVCGNEINRYWHPEYCGFCGKKLVWY